MAKRAPATDTLMRHWQLLSMIPRYPSKVASRDLQLRTEQEDFTVSKRTVERDLMTLSKIFPLVSDAREKPFGWSWQRDALPLDLPSLGNSEALAFALIAHCVCLYFRCRPGLRVGFSHLTRLRAPCANCTQ